MSDRELEILREDDVREVLAKRDAMALAIFDGRLEEELERRGIYAVSEDVACERAQDARDAYLEAWRDRTERGTSAHVDSYRDRAQRLRKERTRDRRMRFVAALG